MTEKQERISGANRADGVTDLSIPDDLPEAAIAEQIARCMHRDQVDKSGRPYVEHLERVAANVCDEAKAAAWLHDVVEDTDMTVGDLQDMGRTSMRTNGAVDLLTRRDSMTHSQYIQRIYFGAGIFGEVAREVKIADLKDNLSDDRRYEGDESMRVRYMKALEILERQP